MLSSFSPAIIRVKYYSSFVNRIVGQRLNEQEIRAAIRRRFAEGAEARQPDDGPDAG